MGEVVTVLVAGHSAPPRLPPVSQQPALFRRLGEVVMAITSGLDGAAGLRLLTGVAAGTDRVAAELAQAQQLPLHLLAPGNPEPLSPSQAAAERIVWLGASDIQHQAGEPLDVRDHVALAFADMVLVVWDGDVPPGHVGRTVRLVLQAAQHLKPVLWLNTAGEVRWLDRTRLTLATLNLLRSPHPESGLLRGLFSAALPISALPAAVNQEIATMLPRNTPAVPLSADHPALGQVMEARMAYSGKLADRAGKMHRRFIWISYLASAFAVFAAVAGAIGLWPGGHNNFWAFVELTLIAGIIAGVILARSRDWHGQWIRQRFIAEQLRCAKLAIPMLCIPEHFTKPMWVASKGGLELLSNEHLILHRTLIQEGLPHGPDTKTFLPNSIEVQSQHIAVLRATVADQFDYHTHKHHKTHVQHERLHKLSLGLFVLTFVAVLLHFVIHANWLLICTAFFPALAAALHGLSAKLEIGRIAGQSHATAAALAALSVAIDGVAVDSSWDGWLRIRELTLAAAQLMSTENAQWQALISHQQAELPA